LRDLFLLSEGYLSFSLFLRSQRVLFLVLLSSLSFFR
jgi:hypothetical protein